MELKKEIMNWLVNDMESMLKEEQNENYMWLNDTYALVRGTGDEDSPRIQELKEQCTRDLKLSTEALAALTKDQVITKFALETLKKHYEYYLADLGPNSDWYDFGVVGMMAAWIHEYDECGVTTIEFMWNGQWFGFEA